MATIEIKSIKHNDGDQKEGRLLSKLETYSEHLEQQWIDFIETIDEISDHGYAQGTTSYWHDYLLFKQRAEEGEPIALAIKEKYILWLLTQ